MAVKDIADVMIVHSDGSQWKRWGWGGYLDIGLIDTMKDLMVNFLGAVVFSIIGYFYVKEKGKGRLCRAVYPKGEARKRKMRPKWGQITTNAICAAARGLSRERPYAHAVFPDAGTD